MNDPDFGLLLHESMMVMLRIGGPPLLAMLVAGVVIAVLQAVTQINETSLVFLPKLIVLGGTLLLLGPSMFATLAGYTQHLFSRVAAFGAL